MKRVLCIWLPQWPLQRLAAAEPREASHSDAISPGSLYPAGAVVLYQQQHAAARAVSYAPDLATAAAAPWQRGPRRAGIREGMPLAEALALAEHAERGGAARSAPRRVEPHDPLADRLALDKLAEWSLRFAPTVGLEDGPRPESLLLDVTGLGRLAGGEAALARGVVGDFARRRLTARVAIADTLEAAWAVAHFAPLTGSPASAAAILRALAEPLVIAPGQVAAALAGLPLQALRLPGDCCALLADLGIGQVEQLAALPRPTLLARFGPAVLEKLDRAHGRAPDALVARAANDPREFSCSLESPTPRGEVIEAALESLIAQACRSLSQQRLGLLRFECHLNDEHGGGQPLRLGLYRPSASPRHIMDLVRLQLESLVLNEPVAAVRLHVLAADRLQFYQQQLFEAAPQRGRADPRALAALVDRLSNRLGPGAVVRPRLLAGAQPEWACQYQPLAQLAGQPRRRATPPAAAPAGARPLYLRPRPRRLAAVSLAPEGPPRQLVLWGRSQRIVRVWAPERIETGWWRMRGVRRDYYQVETADGGRFWVFRQLAGGHWFLHGQFA